MQRMFAEHFFPSELVIRAENPQPGSGGRVSLSGAVVMEAKL